LWWVPGREYKTMEVRGEERRGEERRRTFCQSFNKSEECCD